MNIDKELLKIQIAFLDNYNWGENGIPIEVSGIRNLLRAIVIEGSN